MAKGSHRWKLVAALWCVAECTCAAEKADGVPNATLSVSDGRITPVLRVPPLYPKEAVKKRQKGFVVVHVDVNEDGTVAAVRVIDSEPKALFEAVAVTAVMKWRFKPVIVNGKAVRQSGTQKLNFGIDLPKK